MWSIRLVIRYFRNDTLKNDMIHCWYGSIFFDISPENLFQVQLPGLIEWREGLLGTVSIRKTVLPGMAIPMLKIRRPNDLLIFNMEIAIRR